MLLNNIKRAIQHPDRAFNYASQKVKENLFWDYYYSALREPKVKSAVPQDRKVHEEVIRQLKKADFNPLGFDIDVEEFKQYLHNAQYRKYPTYYGGNQTYVLGEKSLEHFVAAKLLQLSKEDTYIDIASSKSPAPAVYRQLYGCEVFRQDLVYPKGLRGNVIGGDAGDMPVEDGFASKMALHCSFEHFEGDSDFKFIREAGRVIRSGGKLCILPLYLFTSYAIQTDPAAMPKGGISFENDAVLYCQQGWGAMHARFYDIPHLITRVRDNMNGFKLTIYVVKNEKEVSPSCYLKFVALFEKE